MPSVKDSTIKSVKWAGIEKSSVSSMDQVNDNRTYRKVVKSQNFLFILLISLASVAQWCSLPFIGNTALWWIIDAYVLYLFYCKRQRHRYYRIPAIAVFFVMVALSAVYALAFQAKNYWDYRLMIGNILVYSLPLTAYLADNPRWVSGLMRYWTRYAFVLLLVLMPFLQSDGYGKFLVPFTMLALFFPILLKNSKIMVLVAFVVILVLGNDSRSDTIKFAVALLLGCSMYVLGFGKKNIRKEYKLRLIYHRIKKHRFVGYFFKTGHVFLLGLPALLLALAVSGQFNIFNVLENAELESERYSTSDTRTLLYLEEIQSATSNGYVIQGRSLARGHDTAIFADRINYGPGQRYGERPSSEVFILNIFNYFGLIGVFVLCFIFVQASYRAIYRSRNHYIPLVGLYVAFRWAFAFVEDFTRFDLNIMFLWLMIGMCYSPVFRNMTDMEIRQWVSTLFPQRKNRNTGKIKS